MDYDFDLQVNRRNTNSIKWDIKDRELPMWVADMDFQTAPEIMQALKERIEHGVFGYTSIPDEWCKSYINWWNKRHDFLIEKEWIIFCTGVVPAISSIVRKLTTPAENVLIQTPVYNIFFNSILNNGCNVIQNQLKYEANTYSIDFVDLEQKLSDPQTTLMILCNPHNPIGKVWNREILAKIGILCAKHHVIVIADEIHGDLVDPQCKYIPFASVSIECQENSVTCIAPTKAFNLAGLQTAAVVIPNANLRHKVNRGLNTDEIAEPNAFAITATIAAFNKGALWLEALLKYLYKNKQVAIKYIQEEILGITIVPSEGTYLLWLDCSKIPGESTEIGQFIRQETGLFLSDGTQFGGNGKHFLRMNIACRRCDLEEGLRRLKAGLTAYGAWLVKRK